MTQRNTRPLTALQRLILDFLWSKGLATGEAVRQALLPAHDLKDSTVRTLLRRLEARGLVSHDVDGKVFVYRAKAASRSVAARSVRQMIEGFWAGSVEQFLVGMVDEKVVTAAELERLAKKVKQRK